MRSNLPQTALATFLGGFMSLVINRTAVLPAIAIASLASTIIVVCLALVELRADDKHADIDELVKHQRKQPGVLPMYDKTGRRIETEAERTRSLFP